jgi:hypothetical protein
VFSEGDSKRGSHAVVLMLGLVMERWMSEEEMVRVRMGEDGRRWGAWVDVRPQRLCTATTQVASTTTLHHPTTPPHPPSHRQVHLHTSNLHTPSVSQQHSGVSQCIHADNHGARHTHPITDAPGLRDACATDF